MATVEDGARGRRGLAAGVLELLLIAGLYLAYTGSRVLADDNVAAALHRARRLVRFEDLSGLSWEHAANGLFVRHGDLGLFASYWYSTAHYVVTAGILVWLWSRGRHLYVPARRALAIATILGLGLYLLMPTAPPRMLGGYVDVLALHAREGWWGSDASAPRGLGGLTNELAAFPSLHAGWSLWVALTLRSASRNRLLHAAGFLYAATTAFVVIGTANHWVVDVLVGWMVVGVGWVAALLMQRVTPCMVRRAARRAVAVPARVAQDVGSVLEPTSASGRRQVSPVDR